MRLSSVYILLTFCLPLFGTVAEAAPSLPSALDAGKAEHGEVTIAPHRAIYDMTLSSVKNGSNITDISGKMIFEWADACDGWTIQQNLQLHFAYNEGDGSNVASNEVTWEAKDGKHYNFNIRRVQDGKETDNYRGKAELTDDEGKAVYTMPEGKTLKLTNNSVFPSSHTKMILEKALAGEHFFTRRVFDGTDEGGSNDVSAFIGAARTARVEVGAHQDIDSNPLLMTTYWPVHLAFFKLHGETGEPDYEMDLQLHENGIVQSLSINYGDFTVNGKLVAIEPLPMPHC